MNIFATSNCPVESAKFLDNKRVTKMVLETAQLLSTALRVHGYTGSDIYKIAHLNHPSNKWTRSTIGNYNWLLNHFKALCSEYTRRYGKIHKSQSLTELFEKFSYLIPEGEQTPFSNNARNLDKGVDYTQITDVNIAYQLYLSDRWESDKLTPIWD